MGLANPLPRVELPLPGAGETTLIWSDWRSSWGLMPARMAAAESRTEGTECSSCSVVFERGIRCGLGGWVAWSGCGDGGESGSISLSKIAEEEECL
jgi:hypothetical protein